MSEIEHARPDVRQQQEQAALAAAARQWVPRLGPVLAEQERRRREAAQVADEELAAQTAAQRQAALEASAARMRAHLGLDRQPLDDGEPRFESQVSDDPAVVAAVARMKGTRA